MQYTRNCIRYNAYYLHSLITTLNYLKYYSLRLSSELCCPRAAAAVLELYIAGDKEFSSVCWLLIVVPTSGILSFGDEKFDVDVEGFCVLALIDVGLVVEVAVVVLVDIVVVVLVDVVVVVEDRISKKI